MQNTFKLLDIVTVDPVVGSDWDNFNFLGSNMMKTARGLTQALHLTYLRVHFEVELQWYSV